MAKRRHRFTMDEVLGTVLLDYEEDDSDEPMMEGSNNDFVYIPADERRRQ